LSASDTDTDATRTWSIQDTPSTTYGTIAIDPATGTWTYSLDNTLDATKALKENEVVTQTYTARVTDDFGAYVDQTITVTINGTNDVPVVTNANTEIAGTVIEAGNQDNGTIVPGTSTVTGNLSASDTDTDATRTWSIQGTPSATYGAIAIDATTGEWAYSLDNTLDATKALKENEVVSQTYTARVTDDFGAYVDQTIIITITGTNDAPVLAHPLTAPETGQTLQPFQYDVPVDTFSDTDRTDTITYSVAGLPTGLVFSPDTLQITGTPTVSGTFDITIIGTDQQEAFAQEVISLIINPAPAPVAPDTPTPTPSDSQQGDGSSSLSDPAETLSQTTETGDTQSESSTDFSSLDIGTGYENDGGESDGTESGSSDGGANNAGTDNGGDESTTGQRTSEGQDSVTSQATVQIDTDGTVQFTDQNNENAAGALAIESLNIDSETGILELQIRDASWGSASIYMATLADNSPLPQWLNFNPLTGTITGTPPANIHKIELIISTTDGGNTRHVLEITINFDENTQNVSQTSGNDSVTETNDSHIAARGLQPLSAQFAMIRAQTNDYGQSLMEALA